MPYLSTFPNSRLHSLLLSFFVFFFAILLIMYPAEAVKSSVHGLHIWWNVVFPALLPFFIAAEMMMGLGVVHFFGILLEPLMRPVFRVPGVGAFVMTVGLISGNPMGAKLTARLREQNLLTREEGERLVSFTSTAGPLFLFGAVSVGFFESPSLGIIFAIAHYLSAFIVGYLMRFHEIKAIPTPIMEKKKGFILFRALRSMHLARLKDERPLGKLLGEAVTSAMQTLLLIGGFIMVFSVITHLISYIGLAAWLSNGLGLFLVMLNIPLEMAHSLLVGTFEMTLGSQLVSATSVPLIFKCVIVSMIVGFNGLSVHAQVISMLSKTDIRYHPYFVSRILHGILAAIITWLIFDPLKLHLKDLPTFTTPMAEIDLTPFWAWQYIQVLSVCILCLWTIFILNKWISSFTQHKT